MEDLLEEGLEAEDLQEAIRAAGQEEAIGAHQGHMAIEVLIVRVILTDQVLDFMEDQEKLRESQGHMEEILAVGQGLMENLSFQEGSIRNCR